MNALLGDAAVITVTDVISAGDRTRLEADTVTLRGVLELALRDARRATIGVIGSRADSVTDCLREMGHEAETLSLTSRSSTKREVIVATDCLERADDPATCLRQIKRLLSPTGRLVLVVQNGAHASVRLAMLLGQYSLSASGSAFRLFTLADVERLLDEAGFTVIGVERQIDRPEMLTWRDRRVPEPIVELLSRDADAMTSHFAFVSEPHAVAPVGVLRRRVYEIAEQQRAASRDAQGLHHRVAALEARAGDDGREERATMDAAMAQTLSAIERLGDQLRRIDERLDAADAVERERERARARTREALIGRIDEMKAVIAGLERGRYRRLIRRLRQIVARQIPRESIVAVISRGDPELLTFDRHRGWHFPQTDNGVYAGCHPADSAEAIAHLERLRRRGAQYLVIPQTAFWWLDHYREFADHLQRRHRCLLRDERTCVLFALKSRGPR